MGFWGIEVKPDDPVPYYADNVRGKLHITQATLGLGSSKEKSILQCSVGHNSPIFLCSLLPNKTESCPLNLEFDRDQLVAFSVIGPQSIHLSGYFVAEDEDDVRDDYEYDSFGEDIADSETDGSSEYDTEDEYGDSEDEYGEECDDSDLDMYPPSPVPNSGVIIEEIEDEEKPANRDGPSKKPKRKNQSGNLEDEQNLQRQIVVRDNNAPVLESEDEDGFPISTTNKGKSDTQKAEAEPKQRQKRTQKTDVKKVKGDDASSLKRKVESVEQDGHSEGKKKKVKEQAKGESARGNDNEVSVHTEDERKPEEVKTSVSVNQVSHSENETEEKPSSENVVEKKKKKQKKKKKKTQEVDEGTNLNQNAKQSVSTLESGQKKTEVKSSQVRTFPNGLVIEELAMGKPDGKRASPGKQVSVHYIGKLKNNGKIFDSNVGRAPFKFRLGIGSVIKGWDVGVNGMRIGDKRRLTIPPAMGYGAKRAGSIPPNSWLVFDVELVDVR